MLRDFEMVQKIAPYFSKLKSWVQFWYLNLIRMSIQELQILRYLRLFLQIANNNPKLYL